MNIFDLQKNEIKKSIIIEKKNKLIKSSIIGSILLVPTILYGNQKFCNNNLESVYNERIHKDNKILDNLFYQTSFKICKSPKRMIIQGFNILKNHSFGDKEENIENENTNIFPFIELRELINNGFEEYTRTDLPIKDREKLKIKNLIIVYHITTDKKVAWVSPISELYQTFHNKAPLHIGLDNFLYTDMCLTSNFLSELDLEILNKQKNYLQIIENGVEYNYLVSIQDFIDGELPTLNFGDHKFTYINSYEDIKRRW